METAKIETASLYGANGSTPGVGQLTLDSATMPVYTSNVEARSHGSEQS